ncbi:TetR/AcrR family transcriptional regulator [Arthrobacter sp. TmT3-37]
MNISLSTTLGVRPVRRRPTTRAQLIDAAAALFREQGITNVSVEAICTRTGFTRGAFYSSFKTVDELFFACPSWL